MNEADILYLKTGIEKLSRTQKEVYEMIVKDGIVDREELCNRLFLSKATVACHIKDIYAKLGYGGRAALAKMIYDYWKLRGTFIPKKVNTAEG